MMLKKKKSCGLLLYRSNFTSTVTLSLKCLNTGPLRFALALGSLDFTAYDLQLFPFIIYPKCLFMLIFFYIICKYHLDSWADHTVMVGKFYVYLFR